MAYSHVASYDSGGGTTVSLTIVAGQSLVIMAGESNVTGVTLSLSDTLGNTYTFRGGADDTYNGGYSAIFDCLSPTAGATTITIATTGGSAFFQVEVYTGLASYSAGSYTSAFFKTPTTGIDSVLTSSITPTSTPAMIFGGSLTGNGGAAYMSAGTGFTLRQSSYGHASGEGLYTEDLRLTSGSNVASFDGNAAVQSVTVHGAAYIEASSGGATGSAAITEGADSVSATGTASTAGTAAITEGTDTVSASGSTSTAGTAAITEGADTVSASGVAGAGGIASITEGADSVSASGATSTAGTASITEGADTVAASGVASTAGAAAITERPDTVSATGTAAASGTGVAGIFEGSDIVVASGSGSTIPAGRHRKRYGVRDGDKLLIFDTRAQANEAKKAIAERVKPQKAPIRILVKPAESVPLAEIAKAAETAQELPRYRELLRTKSYTPLVGLYDNIISRSQKAAEAQARAKEAERAQKSEKADHEHIARTLLQVDLEHRQSVASLAAELITHLGAYLDRRDQSRRSRRAHRK